MLFCRSFSAFSLLLLIFSLGGTLPSIHVQADQYDQVCKGPDEGLLKIRKTHCEAAKQAEKAEEGHIWSMGMWTAVGTVCAVACVEITQTMSTACTTANIAGTVGDIAITTTMTKDMQAAIGTFTGLGGNFLTGGYNFYDVASSGAASAGAAAGATAAGSGPASSAAQAASEAAADAVAEQNASAQKTACWSAAIALGKVGMSYWGQQTAAETQKQELETAAGLQGVARSFSSPSYKRQATPLGRSVAGSTNSPGKDSIATEENSGSSCYSCLEQGQGQSFVSCAVANDSSLPPVANSDFFDAFKEVSGGDLGDFVGNYPAGANPAAVMGALLDKGNGTGEAGTAALEKVMNDILTANGGRATYSGGGLAKKSSDSDDGVGKTMKDLMAKFLNKKKGPKSKKTPVNEMDFKLAKMDASSIMQDRSISLFDRVAYRYQRKKTSLEPLPFASPYNRAIAGSSVEASSRQPQSLRKINN